MSNHQRLPPPVGATPIAEHLPPSAMSNSELDFERRWGYIPFDELMPPLTAASEAQQFQEAFGVREGFVKLLEPRDEQTPILLPAFGSAHDPGHWGPQFIMDIIQKVQYQNWEQRDGLRLTRHGVPPPSRVSRIVNTFVGTSNPKRPFCQVRGSCGTFRSPRTR